MVAELLEGNGILCGRALEDEPYCTSVIALVKPLDVRGVGWVGRPVWATWDQWSKADRFSRNLDGLCPSSLALCPGIFGWRLAEKTTECSCLLRQESRMVRG